MKVLATLYFNWMAGTASASCQQADKDIKVEGRRGSAKNSEQTVYRRIGHLFFNLVRLFSGYAGHPVNFI